MGKVIVLHNQKGGVGKTSITYGLAHELASKGYKTLVIDCDGQANLTSDLLTAQQHSLVQKTIADAIISYSIGRGGALPVVNVRENLDLVPSGSRISGIDIVLSRTSNPSSVFLSLLKPLEKKYDIILVDLAPGAGLLAMNILSSADYVLVPSLLDDNSFRGTIKVLQFLKKYVPKLHIDAVGILLNQYSLFSRLTKSVYANFAGSLSRWILSTKIRRNVAVGMAMRQHVSFAEIDSNSNAANDIKALADELISKLKIASPGPIHLRAGDEITITKSGVKITHRHE